MNIIKRSGQEVIFDATKIEDAVKKANGTVQENDRLSGGQIHTVVDSVTSQCAGLKRSPNVEEIQDMVQEEIMKQRAY